MSEATPPARDQILVTAPPAIIMWPLTTDGLDTDGGNELVALTGNPISSGVGFVANGYDTKLQGALPAWAAGKTSNVHMHVRAKVPAELFDWRDVIAALATWNGDTPKLELAVLADQHNSAIGNVVLRPHTTGSTVTLAQTKRLNRANWRFEFRAPELVSNGIVKLQGSCWLDEDTILFAGYSGATSVLYRVDAVTGEYTGRAISTTYVHINSMHVDQNGDVWCQCTVGGFDQRKRLDLATSFATGAITESGSWNTGDIPTSSIAFATVGGVDYVLLSQHATSGTPRCYVLPLSSMAGPVNQVDAVKRFRIGLSVQDLAQRSSDGLLYLSRSASGGRVEAYDLAAILAGPDDGSPAPVATHYAPWQWTQGIDFNPATGRALVGSEGRASVGDDWAYCSLWSSDLNGPEENSYLIDYLGSSIQVRLNGRLMFEFNHAGAGQTPTHITVGAAPASVAGQTGFLTAGVVRSLAIKSVPFTQADLDTLT